jgi:hypothetical protein
MKEVLIFHPGQCYGIVFLDYVDSYISISVDLEGTM